MMSTRPENKTPYSEIRRHAAKHGEANAITAFIDRLEKRTIERVRKIEAKLDSVSQSDRGGLSPNKMLILRAAQAAILQREIGAVPVETGRKKPRKSR